MKMDGTGECNLFSIYTKFSHKSGKGEEFKFSFSELIAPIMEEISHIFRNMMINETLEKVVIIKGKANIFLEIFEKNSYSHSFPLYYWLTNERKEGIQKIYKNLTTERMKSGELFLFYNWSLLSI